MFVPMLGDREISQSSWVSELPNHQVSVIGDIFQNQKIAMNSVDSNSSVSAIAMSGTGANSIIKPLNSSMDSFDNTTRPIFSPLPTEPIPKLNTINNTINPDRLPEKLTSNSEQNLTKTPAQQNSSGGGGTGGFPGNTTSTTSINDNPDRLIDAQIVTQKPEENPPTQGPQTLMDENTKSLAFMLKSISIAFNLRFYHLLILLLIVLIDYRVNRS